MFYIFSIDLLALKKCRILHIENLTSNEKNSAINLLMNIELINSILSIKFEIWNLKNGVSDVNFEI